MHNENIIGFIELHTNTIEASLASLQPLKLARCGDEAKRTSIVVDLRTTSGQPSGQAVPK